MDNAQIEQELEDLESRMERLRALYEQYFLGLEKLEPLVLRKEVDRKLWVMRREQIRNTGLRFKFQMLIQRYNTYQQYWTRVVREIENGTFRRDVIKVAQRFGEKDMLTIVGKKRAEQYKRLAKNQEDRRARRRGKAADQDGAEAKAHDDAIELGEHEIELVEDEHEDIELIDDTDDEASTVPKDVDAHRLPPPTVDVPAHKPRAPAATSEAPLHAHESKHAHHEPDMETLLQLATVGVKEWSRRAGKPAPAIEVKSAKPTIAATMPSPKMVSAPPPDVPALPPTGFGDIPISIAEPGFGEIPISASPPEPVKSGAIPPPRGSSPGVTSAASKSRVAELAAQMRAKKEAAKPKADPLELDGLLDSSTDKPAAPSIPQKPIVPSIPQKPVVPSIPMKPVVPSVSPKPIVPAAPAKAESAPPPAKPAITSAPPPTPDPTTLPEGMAPAKPKADKTPIPIPSLPPTQHSAEPRVATSPFPRPASATSIPGGAPSMSRGAVSIGAPPTAAPKTAVSAGQAPPAASGSLSEQKMREIYAKYVGAKRAANESTAGLTYDKLANSLRAQAEKLHAAHPSRSVDFEVVTKDGKTALRPIVK